MSILEKIGFGAIVLATLVSFGVLLAFPIKWCWNWAVPYCFGGPEIGWGHAICLYILSTLLVKSVHTERGK